MGSRTEAVEQTEDRELAQDGPAPASDKITRSNHTGCEPAGRRWQAHGAQDICLSPELRRKTVTSTGQDTSTPFQNAIRPLM